MSLSRAQTPTLALLASAALFSSSSAAQPVPAPAFRADREIAIAGEADWPGLTDSDLRELLLFVASRRPDSAVCASAGVTPGPQSVEQGKGDRALQEPRVCGGGSFAFMSVKILRAKCTPSTARLTRGGESADVLLLAPHPTALCRLGTCWLVVARAPVGDGSGFTLELLAEDGAPCLSRLVDLNSTPPKDDGSGMVGIGEDGRKANRERRNET